MTDFYTSLRSTIGKLSKDIAASMALPNFEIDDVTAVSEALSSDDPAVLWQLITMQEMPRDPLWSTSFLIGAKTNSDVGNTVLTNIVNEVTNRLPIGQDVTISDYSSPGADQEGVLTVVSATVDPQEYERQAGVRMVSISAVASRDV